MRKICAGGYAGGTSIIELNEDGSGVLKIRYHKMTDPSVTRRWVEKPFGSVRGGTIQGVTVLADGSEQMRAEADVCRGELLLMSITPRLKPGACP